MLPHSAVIRRRGGKWKLFTTTSCMPTWNNCSAKLGCVHTWFGQIFSTCHSNSSLWLGQGFRIFFFGFLCVSKPLWISSLFCIASHVSKAAHGKFGFSLKQHTAVSLVELKTCCMQTRNQCLLIIRFRIGVMPISIFVCSLAHALSIFLLHFPSRGFRYCGTTVLISTLGFGSLWPKFFIHVCTRVMQSCSRRRLSSGKIHRSDEAGCSNLGWVKLMFAS